MHVHVHVHVRVRVQLCAFARLRIYMCLCACVLPHSCSLNLLSQVPVIGPVDLELHKGTLFIFTFDFI